MSLVAAASPSANGRIAFKAASWSFFIWRTVRNEATEAAEVMTDRTTNHIMSL
jgi:hypothetical protein